MNKLRGLRIVGCVKSITLSLAVLIGASTQGGLNARLEVEVTPMTAPFSEYRYRLTNEPTSTLGVLLFQLDVGEHSDMPNIIAPAGWNYEFIDDEIDSILWFAGSEEAWLQPGAQAEFQIQSPLVPFANPYLVFGTNAQFSEEGELAGQILSPGLAISEPIEWPVGEGGNGHRYQFVNGPGGLTWDEAKAAAESLAWMGTPGHLLTLQSQPELDFVQSNLPLANGAWLGASQDLTAPDYNEPAGGWRWVTGEPFDFNPWSTPDNGGNDVEPNNHGGSEHAMQTELSQFNGETLLRANDASGSGRSRAYYVEFSNTGPHLSTWTTDSSGNWSQPASWTAGVPNQIGGGAIFGPAITARRSVSVDVPVTVGRVEFDSEHAYTVSGGNPITLDSAAGDAQIAVVTGSHTISSPIALVDNTTITVTPSASNLSLSGALNATSKSLTKAGAGRLTLNNIRAAGLSITGGTVAIAPSSGASELSTSLLGTLSIAGDATPTAKLDLANSAAVINYAGTSPAATLRQQILAGRGGSGLGKSWNGNGITSSAAAAANTAEPESHSVGFAENATLPLGPYTNFRGQPSDDTSILIAYTRTGDANLDGFVNDDDVTIVGATYASGVPQHSWALGDFDYNGFVDDDDVTLLGVFYDPVASPLVAAAHGDVDVVAVPEPGSLVVFIAGLITTGVFIVLRRLRPNASR